jgi:hypothetical protein
MTWRAGKWLVSAGLLVLFPILLIWQMPAGWALNQLTQKRVSVQTQDVTGSVWNGRINRLVWRGIDLGKIDWRFNGLEQWSPPRGRWTFQGQNHDYRLGGHISISDGSRPELTAVTGSLPAAWVDLSSSLPFVFLAGRFEVDLAHLVLRDTLPVEADGAVLWTAAGLTGLVNESLGDVAFSVETVDQIIRFRIQSLGRPDIRIDGHGQLSGNNYSADLLARVDPQRNDMYELLSQMGTLQADGSILFALSGQLLPEGK